MSAAVHTVPGAGGLPKVVVSHESGAQLEVYLHGATVTSYKTPAGQELLFVSSRAVFDGVKAIRGGIPIVFPQFGTQGPLPQHGFARNSQWDVLSVGNGSVQLQLKDNDATRAVWPHQFTLTLRISFDDARLNTQLDVTNPAGAAGPFAFEALLHTYLYLGAAEDAYARCRVGGLRGVAYLDKPAGNARVVDDADAVVLGTEVDRIYCATPAEVSVTGIESGAAAGARAFTSVTVQRKGSVRDAAPGLRQVVEHAPLDVVVWNAAPAKCAAIADFGPEDWRHYVCVEPGRVGPDTAGFHAHSALAPGKTWTLAQTLAMA